MKSIIKYFDTCSLWIVFGLSFVLFSSIICTGFYYIIPIEDIKIHNAMLKVSIFLALMFSILIVNSVSLSRKSDKFFNYRDEVESLINDTDTVDSLKDIYDVQIQKLWKLSQGGSHSQEVNRLVSLNNIKIKTI